MKACKLMCDLASYHLLNPSGDELIMMLFLSLPCCRAELGGGDRPTVPMSLGSEPTNTLCMEVYRESRGLFTYRGLSECRDWEAVIPITAGGGSSANPKGNADEGAWSLPSTGSEQVRSWWFLDKQLTHSKITNILYCHLWLFLLWKEIRKVFAKTSPGFPCHWILGVLVEATKSSSKGVAIHA